MQIYRLRCIVRIQKRIWTERGIEKKRKDWKRIKNIIRNIKIRILVICIKSRIRKERKSCLRLKNKIKIIERVIRSINIKGKIKERIVGEKEKRERWVDVERKAGGWRVGKNGWRRS